MAIVTNNLLLAGVRGRIGNLLVRQNGKKTIISSMPDMKKVVPTALQLVKREIFKAAVAYAQNITRNPELKTSYQKKLKDGEKLYHFAIKEYYRKLKEGFL
jgi:spore coat protein CotF